MPARLPLLSRSIRTPAFLRTRTAVLPTRAFSCSPHIFSSASAPKPSRTPLYNLHLEKKAKIVTYGGFEMPLLYEADGGGHVNEHNAVRTKAGLFDVSHMVQTCFSGPSTTSFLSSILPTDLSSLKPSSYAGVDIYASSLSVLLNENGAVIDDLVITKWGEDKYYVVTNAGRRDRDLGWFREHLKEWNASKGTKVNMDVMNGWGLLALQGPEAVDVLRPSIKTKDFDIQQLTFGHSAFLDIQIGDVPATPVHVARGGYTGEDGFEISVPPSLAVPLARHLLSNPSVSFSGLAARDSLRIEAGMCLYGNELDEDLPGGGVTVAQAGLSWVIPKSRRTEDAGFVGAEHTAREIKAGPERRRVGIVVGEGGGTARAGNAIFSSSASGEGEEIGTVTSGIPSPTLGQNIAQAYVKSGHHKKGTEVWVERRKGGKRVNAKVVGLPFVENRFWRGASK
ncbi:glycine cleavage system T protein [Atractiella rhizophila]|nr:glycine cleavage system T protein [Atractiella rhizophila]